MKEIRLKYTSYGDLKAGDEFIRPFGGIPVLLNDCEGTRINKIGGEKFYLPYFKYGSQRGDPTMPIYRMVQKREDWLDQVDLSDLEDTDRWIKDLE